MTSKTCVTNANELNHASRQPIVVGLAISGAVKTCLHLLRCDAMCGAAGCLALSVVHTLC